MVAPGGLIIIFRIYIIMYIASVIENKLRSFSVIQYIRFGFHNLGYKVKKRGLIHPHKYCTIFRTHQQSVSSSTFRGFIPFINCCCSLCLRWLMSQWWHADWSRVITWPGYWPLIGLWHADWFEGRGAELRWSGGFEGLLWIFAQLDCCSHWPFSTPPGHHFPKIIFLVFIFLYIAAPGVKLNKNSEIEIHSTIEMRSRMDILKPLAFSESEWMRIEVQNVSLW